MRILILGGTGFIGKPLSQILATQGHSLCVLSRGEKSVDLPASVRHIKADRWKLDDVAPQIDEFEPEVAIDIFAMTEEDDLPVLSFFSKRVQRYVLLSSCDVYQIMGRILGTEPGEVIEGLQSETAPLREKLYPYRKITVHAGGSQYDKIPLERACLNDFEFEGTVMRLPMIFGPGDRQHRFRDEVMHMADRRPVYLLPRPAAKWTSSFGYVDNVAAAIALAATHKDGGGHIFNVADTNDLDMEGWAKAISKAMDWSGEVIVEEKSMLPEKRAALADDGDFHQFIQIDASKIKERLGFRPPVDFETSLKRMVAYEREHLKEVPEDSYDYAADDAYLASRHKEGKEG